MFPTTLFSILTAYGEEAVLGLGTIKSLALSPDGKLLAVGTEEETIKIWETKNWENIANLMGTHQPYTPWLSVRMVST